MDRIDVERALENDMIGDMDAEANRFAMELLMPAEWLLADLKRTPVQIADDNDKNLGRLATKYGVPRTLMAIRIGQLLGVRP